MDFECTCYVLLLSKVDSVFVPDNCNDSEIDIQLFSYARTVYNEMKHLVFNLLSHEASVIYYNHMVFFFSFHNRIPGFIAPVVDVPLSYESHTVFNLRNCYIFGFRTFRNLM